ncbi:hypothetical protein BAUCODRAFT_144914 [Baudoinia panamericana UAMH 10762]|uniref:Uncharacterized protein n=1 Tax=Baudoinia panamericana (strain UAMH 10762) TaxID=717646 RepID=M2LXV1_BAUPA|nr:uncharacterized protein BAUCODRAFT_144914 [Baudoinia panamericana UAMH 10762]EMC99502.1 hypothetical protein BAUCODRAFT_144914 [Baudoinia panamericana UAMH 10762]
MQPHQLLSLSLENNLASELDTMNNQLYPTGLDQPAAWPQYALPPPASELPKQDKQRKKKSNAKSTTITTTTTTKKRRVLGSEQAQQALQQEGHESVVQTPPPQPRQRSLPQPDIMQLLRQDHIDYGNMYTPQPPAATDYAQQQMQEAFSSMQLQTAQEHLDPSYAQSNMQQGTEYQALKAPKPQPETKKAPRKSKKTTTTTTTTMTQVTGGKARRKAAAKGEAELHRFDEEVKRMLVQASGICVAGFPYYKTQDGYLCGGGSHFVNDAEVDAMLEGRRPHGPIIQFVNLLHDKSTWMAPPLEGWHEPFHFDPMTCVRLCKMPLPLRADGTEWPRLEEACRIMIEAALGPNLPGLGGAGCPIHGNMGMGMPGMGMGGFGGFGS